MPDFIVTVQSADTHAPIEDAQVYLDGIGQGSTDSTGTFVISTGDSASHVVAVKADSYISFTTSTGASNIILVSLQLADNPTLTTFRLNIQPEDDASNEHITFNNNGSPIVVSYNSGGITIPGLARVSQTITANIAGYDPVSTVFDLTTQTDGIIVLKSTSQSGQQLQQQTVPTQDPDVSTLLPALTPQQSPEFIAPNTGQGTYFTMTQARMYVGNLFIDELDNMRFALQDNKIPVFGYASRFWDILAQGKSLVQGEFSINFISEGYLYTVLQAYQNTMSDNVEVNPVLAQQQARMLQLVNQLRNPDPAWTPSMFATAKAEIKNLAAALGPSSVSQANAGMSLAIRQQNDSILGLPGGDFCNGVYQDVSFDVVLEYTGAGRTITRRLEQCTLISNESILNPSGTPILDSYGFIARRLR